jgi:hypothetical protein
MRLPSGKRSTVRMPIAVHKVIRMGPLNHTGYNTNFGQHTAPVVGDDKVVENPAKLMSSVVAVYHP